MTAQIRILPAFSPAAALPLVVGAGTAFAITYTTFDHANVPIATPLAALDASAHAAPQFVSQPSTNNVNASFPNM